jgi:rfaE bifunctional protein kinase chain/domain
MEKQNMTNEAVLKSDKRITTTKFRVIGNNYHMLRVDEEITKDINKEEEEKLLEKIKDLTKKHSIGVIIFQDYNKGVLTGRVIKKTLDIAKESGIPVAVDPKKKNFLNYKGVKLFKPNLKELKEGIKADFDISNTSELNTYIQAFQEKQEIRNLLLTLSEFGVYISTQKSKNNYESYRIPAHLRQIADVSGAGDTVISVASLCLALNVHPFNMAALSNLAGGLVCESVGVVPVDKEKLLKEAIEKL